MSVDISKGEHTLSLWVYRLFKERIMAAGLSMVIKENGSGGVRVIVL